MAKAKSQEKTYAMLHKGVFNWAYFLNRKKYTSGMLFEATLKSKRWKSCSVGNQSVDIPREENGMPKDALLRSYGLSFCNAICAMEFRHGHTNFEAWRENAKELLKKIEHRSAVVINRELKKKASKNGK